MVFPKVTIGLILFTGCEKYLPYSLKSLLSQDYPNIEFLLRDQSPNGEIYDYLKKEMPEVFEKAKIEKEGNLMHSGGNNALIQKMTGDYYICASNDMWYPPNFVSKVIEAMEKPENQTFGSATPKLMQWDFGKIDKDGLTASKTNKIDSAGLGLKASHHFFDRGQGEEDRGQYDQNRSIFGPSGALGIYRKKTLEEVAFIKPDGKKEYFDQLLHYKNDVDLAYRLQWAGWPSLFIPDVRVYHDRQVSGRAGLLQSREEKSRWVKENSFFGHLVVLRKNFDPRFSLSVRLKTWLYNTVKFFFILFFEPYLLKQYREVKKHENEIEAKRKMMKRVAKPNDIEKLME